ncbi:MAG: DUF616 domain-containing protein [Flavobacteriales bacterium]|nr:DUF616 domain-containing protein [Flavobacteriales bacterium]
MKAFENLKIAVITANFGGIDSPKELPPQTVEFDRFYFNENNSHFPMAGLDARMKAKFYKMLPHLVLPHDVFVWVDGNVGSYSQYFIQTILEALEGHDIAIHKHPDRETVFEESSHMIREIQNGNQYLTSRYKAKHLQQEMERYGDVFAKGDSSLYWCGLFARFNSPKINKCFEKWHFENILMSNFDQINFSYCTKGLSKGNFVMDKIKDKTGNYFLNMSIHTK